MDAEISNASSQNDQVLDRDYGTKDFIKLIFPSIFTFIFIAFYQIVDGRFIGKYVGPYAIAAVNLYYPIINVLLAIGTMIGTGANAYILELFGMGKKKEANEIFNQVIEVSFVLSVIFAVVCLLFMNPIMKMLGATSGNIAYLQQYYVILTVCAPAILFQTMLGILVIGEGKTLLTGVLIVTGGVANIVLDYVFMAIFGWGTTGAAVATAIGYLTPVIYSFRMYSKNGGSRYHFSFTKVHFLKMIGIFYNGMSEMISNLSAGVTALMMNHIALNLAGEAGVSTVSVFLYVQFIVMAVFMGITTAVEPLFSYYHGKEDHKRTKKIFRMSVLWTMIFSVLMAIVVFVFADKITRFFFEGDQSLIDVFVQIADRSVRLCAPAALFVGLNILSSGLFTAFGNGSVSALLSGIRTLVVFVICLIVMPKIFGIDGLWLSWAAAEAISLIFSIIALVNYRNDYHY